MRERCSRSGEDLRWKETGDQQGGEGQGAGARVGMAAQQGQLRKKGGSSEFARETAPAHFYSILS